MSDLAPEADGSVHDAAAQINALFAPTPTESVAPSAERPRGPDGKFLPAKPKDDDPIPLTPADGSEDPDNPAPQEEPEVAEQEEPEEQEQDEPEEKPAKPVPTVKVKVDGIEQELPLDEVAKGYSRTADYTRKTQALAEERKRFEAEEREPVRQERAVYAERLAQLEDAVQSLLPDREPDWAELRNSLTPDQFTQAFADWRSQAQRMEKIRGERERVAALQEAESNRLMQARLVEEHEKLKAALPEFADPEKGKALKDDLIAYAKSLGYADDDLAQVTDHRVLLMLNKARKYDESQLRRPKLEDKVDRVLESVKPSNTKPKPKMSEIERASTRLKSTGRVEDAAWLINQRLRSK
jgi:hypothetical protein